MKTSTLFNRFAASFVVFAAVGMSAPAMATTASKSAPNKALVSKSAKAGRKIQSKRSKLPRAWTWKKKAVKLDGMFAKR
ncbi:MAG: hypothetical protein AAFV29_22465 [Myxococcota bacterium]